MTTQSNYSLQNFGMNNARVLTGNSQPVPDFKCSSISGMHQKLRLVKRLFRSRSKQCVRSIQNVSVLVRL